MIMTQKIKQWVEYNDKKKFVHDFVIINKKIQSF